MATNSNDYYFDNSVNTMYYTNPQGTLSTITIDSSSTIDTSSYTSSTFSSSPIYTIASPTGPTISLNDIYTYEFPIMREFKDVMPDLTKVEEMCSMYSALDKAFENFKTIYNLVKDDYEVRKNNDS